MMCSLHVLLISRGRVGLLTSAAFMAICGGANHTKSCYTHVQPRRDCCVQLHTIHDVHVHVHVGLHTVVTWNVHHTHCDKQVKPNRYIDHVKLMSETYHQNKLSH